MAGWICCHLRYLIALQRIRDRNFAAGFSRLSSPRRTACYRLAPQRTTSHRIAPPRAASHRLTSHRTRWQVEVATCITRTALGACELLDGCSKPFLDSLSVMLQEAHFGPDAYIYLANEPSLEMFIVDRGSVDLTKTNAATGEEARACSRGLKRLHFPRGGPLRRPSTPPALLCHCRMAAPSIAWLLPPTPVLAPLHGAAAALCSMRVLALRSMWLLPCVFELPCEAPL